MFEEDQASGPVVVGEGAEGLGAQRDIRVETQGGPLHDRSG
jgi:hypothetical protein